MREYLSRGYLSPKEKRRKEGKTKEIPKELRKIAENYLKIKTPDDKRLIEELEEELRKIEQGQRKEVNQTSKKLRSLGLGGTIDDLGRVINPEKTKKQCEARNKVGEVALTQLPQPKIGSSKNIIDSLKNIYEMFGNIFELYKFQKINNEALSSLQNNETPYFLTLRTNPYDDMFGHIDEIIYVYDYKNKKIEPLLAIDVTTAESRKTGMEKIRTVIETIKQGGATILFGVEIKYHTESQDSFQSPITAEIKELSNIPVVIIAIDRKNLISYILNQKSDFIGEIIDSILNFINKITSNEFAKQAGLKKETIKKYEEIKKLLGRLKKERVKKDKN